jgi:hypothetical protein
MLWPRALPTPVNDNRTPSRGYWLAAACGGLLLAAGIWGISALF